MNILIFCGYIDDRKTTDANVNIAKRLCSEISKQGHSVTLAAIHVNTAPKGTVVKNSEDGSYKIALITPPPFVHRHRDRLEQYVQSHPHLPRGAAVMRFMLLHPFSAAVIKYSYSKLYRYDIPENYAAKAVEDYCRANAVDAAVAMTFPFISVLSVFGSNAECRKYIYQLDPYGLHETIPPEYDELEFFSKADGIFTTDILERLYCSHADYQKYIDKTYVLSFPTLVKGKISSCDLPVTFDSSKTNIVFCGSTHDNYRSPKTFLECLGKILEKDKNIVATFVGPHNSATLDSFAALYPDNVRIFPSINSSLIPSVLDKADFLLNMGNSYKLQVPSKIFEYFATGKPIIHQQLISDCSCLEYMEKYPLAFCFEESSDKTADSLYSFIKNNISKTVSSDRVAEIYSGNIPENVAKNLLDIIG